MSPVWISHRGAKAAAVENTREAFRAAVAQGFKCLETDLRLSVDGHVVLHHDPDLRRLAQQSSEIGAMTRAELERIELTGGARLLFLDEFAAEFAACDWIFDVKPETAVRTLTCLVEWAKQKGLTGVLLKKTSFVLWSQPHHQCLMTLLPEASTYAREAECWRAGLSVIAGLPALGGIVAGRTYALPPRLKSVELYTQGKIAAFHERGASVLAFLPESEVDTKAAVDCGVDEILTNGRILGSTGNGSP